MKSVFILLAAVALLGFAAAPSALHAPPTLRQSQAGVINALNANLAAGVATPGSTVSCDLGGVLNSVSIGVQGTYAATLVVQVSADGENWVTVPSSAYAKVADGSTGNLSGAGMWTVPVSGVAARITCSAYTSGAAAVSLIPYSASSSGGGASSSVTANAGANLNTSALALESGGNLATIAGAVSSAKVQAAAVAQAAGGSTPWTNGGAAITTAVTIDSSTGSFYDYAAANASATTGYWVEFFNAASGSVTLGTTAPVWMMYVPPGPSGTVEHFSVPHAFGTALSIAFVTAPNGSSAAPASTCYASVSYK
ncbi:MAG: hypothetical protein ACYC96_16280 [Fimbriimonadaceae bacterium]